MNETYSACPSFLAEADATHRRAIAVCRAWQDQLVNERATEPRVVLASSEGKPDELRQGGLSRVG
jgi:hypothetical protein